MNFPSNGRIIKELRKELKISQSELAMGRINVNTVCKLENDKMSITPVLALILSDNINRLAKQKGKNFKVTTADLMMSESKKCECWCLSEMEAVKSMPETGAKINKLMEILENACSYGLYDVIEKVYVELGKYFFEENNIEKAVEYYSLAFERFEKSDNAYSAAGVLNDIGKCYHNLDVRRAKELYNKASTIIKETKSDYKSAELNSKLLYNKALCCILERDYEGTLENIQEFRHMETGDADIRTRMQILKGISEMLCRQYEKSVDTFTDILNCRESGIKKYEYIIFNNLAISLYHSGRTEDALAYFEKAVREQLPASRSDITFSLLNSAYGYLNGGNCDISLRYAEGALHSALEHRQHERVIDCYHIMYKIYLDKKNLEKCGELLEKCMEHIKENNMGEEYVLSVQFMYLRLLFYKNDYQKAKDIVENIINAKAGINDSGSKPVEPYNIIYPQPAPSAGLGDSGHTGK